jgi:7-carboxy-7-deazaguanine synthase
MHVDRILERIGLPYVCITGGEPLLQRMELVPLMHALIAAGRTVSLETSGSLPLDSVPDGVHVTLDWKPPGSGESHRNNERALMQLKETDEVKFVVADRTDYEWAVDVMRKRSVPHPIFSPVHGRLEAGTLGSWMVQDGIPARLGIQLHKVLWPNAVEEV